MLVHVHAYGPSTGFPTARGDGPHRPWSTRGWLFSSCQVTISQVRRQARDRYLYLGIALAKHNDFDAATNEFSEAMRLAPTDPAPLVEWARAHLQQGRDTDALDKLNQALQLDPDNFQTLAFMAHVLAADDRPWVRDGSAALGYARKASALTGGTQPLVEDVLAMAQAETGQFADAQNTVSNAIQLATTAGMKPDTIAEMQKRLALYQKRLPWRESFQTGGKK